MTVTVEPGGKVLKPYPLHQVALIGMGPSAVAFANDVYYEHFRSVKGESERWTLNYGQQVWQHDLLFNMRDLVYEHQNNPAGSFFGAYGSHDRPIVTTRYVESIPNCFEFPFEEVFKTFGDSYFACGPAFMMAFASLCLEAMPNGRKQLGLYGMDYNYQDQEAYEAGRPCLEYWIGRAVQRGINVSVPPSSALMDQFQRNHGNGAAGNGKIYGCQGLEPIFDTECATHMKLIGWKDRNDPG